MTENQSMIRDVQLLRAEKLYLRALSLQKHDPSGAWKCISMALAAEPTHSEANELAGHLWLWEWEAIGYPDHSHEEAARVALEYFEQSVKHEPLYANGWAGKASALKVLGDPSGMLEAASTGLKVLDRQVGHQMANPRVFRLVAEELYDLAIEGCHALQMHRQAEQLLVAGLKACPDSEYLLRNQSSGG